MENARSTKKISFYKRVKITGIDKLSGEKSKVGNFQVQKNINDEAPVISNFSVENALKKENLKVEATTEGEKLNVGKFSGIEELIDIQASETKEAEFVVEPQIEKPDLAMISQLKISISETDSKVQKPAVEKKLQIDNSDVEIISEIGVPVEKSAGDEKYAVENEVKNLISDMQTTLETVIYIVDKTQRAIKPTVVIDEYMGNPEMDMISKIKNISIAEKDFETRKPNIEIDACIENSDVEMTSEENITVVEKYSETEKPTFVNQLNNLMEITSNVDMSTVEEAYEREKCSVVKELHLEKDIEIPLKVDKSNIENDLETETRDSKETSVEKEKLDREIVEISSKVSEPVVENGKSNLKNMEISSKVNKLIIKNEKLNMKNLDISSGDDKSVCEKEKLDMENMDISIEENRPVIKKQSQVQNSNTSEVDKPRIEKESHIEVGNEKLDKENAKISSEVNKQVVKKEKLDMKNMEISSKVTKPVIEKQSHKESSITSEVGKPVIEEESHIESSIASEVGKSVVVKKESPLKNTYEEISVRVDFTKDSRVELAVEKETKVEKPVLKNESQIKTRMKEKNSKIKSTPEKEKTPKLEKTEIKEIPMEKKASKQVKKEKIDVKAVQNVSAEEISKNVIKTESLPTNIEEQSPSLQEPRRELRRERKLNPKYASNEYTSIFSSKRTSFITKQTNLSPQKNPPGVSSSDLTSPDVESKEKISNSTTAIKTRERKDAPKLRSSSIVDAAPEKSKSTSTELKVNNLKTGAVKNVILKTEDVDHVKSNILSTSSVVENPQVKSKNTKSNPNGAKRKCEDHEKVVSKRLCLRNYTDPNNAKSVSNENNPLNNDKRKQSVTTKSETKNNLHKAKVNGDVLGEIDHLSKSSVSKCTRSSNKN